jgi:hypothetical protein
MAGKHALKKPNEAKHDTKDRTVDATTVARVLKHPAAAPTAVTVVAIALVMGMGWLNRTSEVGPAALATPLGEGRRTTGEVQADDGQPGGPTGTTGPVLATRGRRAVLVPTWMDLPLVTPALAVQPDAIGMLIPGAQPTAFPAPGAGSGSGSSGSGTGTTGTTQAGTGTTAGPGGGGTTVTTGTSTTNPPDITPTTQPPDTTPATDPPDTTEPPPTTDTTTTEPPTTETIPPASEEPGGLLDVVDDLLDTVSPAVEPLPLL